MLKHLLPILFVLIASYRSEAGVTEFENEQRPDFFSAIGGEQNVSTVDFTGFDDLTPVTDQWSHLGVEFSGFVLTSGFDDFINPNDGWGVFAQPEIIVDFDQPMQWIAADFPGTLGIELFSNDQSIYTSTTLASGGTGNFGGLISDQPFDRARIFDPADSIVAIDDLHFGPPIAVPTPGALGAFALLILVRHRRRRFSTVVRDGCC